MWQCHVTVLYSSVGLPPGPIELLYIFSHATNSISLRWTVENAIYVDYYNVSHNYTIKGCEAPPGPLVTMTYEDGLAEPHGPAVFIRHLPEHSTVWITVTLVNDVGTAMASIAGQTTTFCKYSQTSLIRTPSCYPGTSQPGS